MERRTAHRSLGRPIALPGLNQISDATGRQGIKGQGNKGQGFKDRQARDRNHTRRRLGPILKPGDVSGQCVDL